jgi:uncharacterized protein (DUF433 family)
MSTAKIPKELQGVLVSTEDTLGGTIRFAGTRVPVQALIDTIASGNSLEEFFGGFPNVTREQAEAVLVWEHDQARKILGLARAS